jgi:hypothetical protein
MRKSRLAPNAVRNGAFVSSVCSVQRTPRPWVPPPAGAFRYSSREQNSINPTTAAPWAAAAAPPA